MFDSSLRALPRTMVFERGGGACKADGRPRRVDKNIVIFWTLNITLLISFFVCLAQCLNHLRRKLKCQPDKVNSDEADTNKTDSDEADSDSNEPDINETNSNETDSNKMDTNKADSDKTAATRWTAIRQRQTVTRGTTTRRTATRRTVTRKTVWIHQLPCHYLVGDLKDLQII